MELYAEEVQKTKSAYHWPYRWISGIQGVITQVVSQLAVIYSLRF